jgi:uncharacterized protein YjdB
VRPRNRRARAHRTAGEFAALDGAKTGLILAPVSGHMRIRGGSILLAAMLAALAPRPVAAADPVYVCAPARADGGSGATLAVSVTDRFATRALSLPKAAAMCWPEAPGQTMLEAFAARARPRRTARVGTTIDLVTRFGSQRVHVGGLAALAVESAATGVPADDALRTCYLVRGGRPARKTRIAVAEAAGERLFDVGRPRRLCVPTDGAEASSLLCHAARLARTKPLAQPKPQPFTTTLTNRFGTDTLRVGAPSEVCVPVARPVVVQPTFTLEVLPHTFSPIAGGQPKFLAVAHFDDGHDESYTGKVQWASSDEGVAKILSSSATGAYIDTIAPGTTTISATDPATGVSSDDPGGTSAVVTVRWPLEKLTIEPHAVTKRPGAHEGYTVVGHFTGGFTRNVTQRVVYASSDGTVADATNLAGNRSRVEALAQGTTTISATDPITGISTTDAGNDATLRVTGALSSLWVTSRLQHPSIFPGESHAFSARGYFSDGSSLNLTQECEWHSYDPAVAAATNPPGNRSRIDGIAPGATTIWCVDPVTGKQAYAAPFWVLGDLVSIDIFGGYGVTDWIRNGEWLAFLAIGRYVGGGDRNLTQEVVWTSRDPDIVTAPNQPPTRSRVFGVGPGTARIFATDPATGITSADASVFSLGALVRLELHSGYRGEVIPVGATVYYRVRGVYENGTLNLGARGGYTLESSDPSVLEVVSPYFVRGVTTGKATLTARDTATGAIATSVLVTVKGALESITLVPATATRGIGEWESFTATGHYAPDLTSNLTQYLFYGSSDPSVAVADNAPGERSRIRTVGAGTTTITATDPATQVTATAELTVLPGTIDRVTIEPAEIVRNLGNGFSFTAIGHYPGGATINVTQVVTWQSLAPDIAEAKNPAGDRSRVKALLPGVAGIAAVHPSGVSSHDTDDDAIFTAKTLAGLTLTPMTHKGHVGTTERYTLVGTFDDATTINLTQDALYWTADPLVADAPDVDGDRSAVDLLAPGITTVNAALVDRTGDFPVQYSSPEAAFVLVEP